MYCSHCGELGHYALNCPNRSKEKPNTVYKREWRKRNRERYNAYMRGYMRKRRGGV